MRKLAATLVVLSLGVFASSANASAVPLPPASVTVVKSATAVKSETSGIMGGYAYADVANYRIVTSGPLTRRDKAHEVGHIFDWNALNDDDRAKLSVIMGAPTDRTWWQLRGGAEWFADYYSAIANNVDPRPHSVAGGGIRVGSDAPYAKLTWKRMNRVRQVLLAVAARDGLSYGQIR